MSVLISLVVSDRNEMEGGAGLHAEVLLKRGLIGRTFAIVGTATFSDEMKIATVTIVEDALGVGNDISTLLVRAAFEFCWNAVVIGDCASAGMKWQPFAEWSASNLASEMQTVAAERVTARLLAEF